MQLVGAILSLGMVALGVVLAFRLLRLGARNRTAPELAMGLYCLLVSMATLLFGLTLRAAAAGSAAAFPLSAAYTLCIALAAFALAVGIWRIFRPGEAWARALAIGAGVWILASWIACVLPGHPVLLADLTTANVFFVAGRVAVYLYGAFEAFRYGAMLRRRAALGLADPVSANQILLWGVAWLCVAGVAVGSVLIMQAMGRSSLESPFVLVVLSALNVAAWICTWLAFFPPRAYQRWVAGTHGEAAA